MHIPWPLPMVILLEHCIRETVTVGRYVTSCYRLTNGQCLRLWTHWWLVLASGSTAHPFKQLCSSGDCLIITRRKYCVISVYFAGLLLYCAGNNLLRQFAEHDWHSLGMLPLFRPPIPKNMIATMVRRSSIRIVTLIFGGKQGQLLISERPSISWLRPSTHYAVGKHRKNAYTRIDRIVPSALVKLLTTAVTSSAFIFTLSQGYLNGYLHGILMRFHCCPTWWRTVIFSATAVHSNWSIIICADNFLF